MKKVQTVKGTHDLLADDFLLFDKIINCFETLCRHFNYTKIATPILEFTDLFSRTLGKSSDIVSKEMYTFIDQGKDSLTLRPEGTAPVARALVSNSLYENLSQKFYYFGPMFRRERPQAGRLRQFHQFGVEYFNNKSFQCEIEIIILAQKILLDLSILNEVKLNINTLGNQKSRNKFKLKLVEYFSKYKNELSNDSKARLEKNPLRILDSKDPSDKKLIETSPKILSFLDDDSRFFYESFKETLLKLNINFVENPNLVRGLDYYNHTAFEFIELNQQSNNNTILAGGRYDGLVNAIGGKDVCGVGWAAGIERISSIISKNHIIKNNFIISIFTLSDELDLILLKVIKKIKNHKNFSFNIIYSGSVKKKFSRANKIHSKACLIFGPDEYKDGNMIFKDLNSGTQEIFKISKVNDFLMNKSKNLKS